MTGHAVLLNEDGARRYAERLENPVVRNLVLMGLSQVKMSVVRKAGQPEAEWRAELPAEPIDMEFLARVLTSMFGSPDVLRAVLDGKTLARASGWDL